eukprot:COSAG04_NODE_13830_length_590_cov_1.755601_1_plen_48_part_10
MSFWVQPRDDFSNVRDPSRFSDFSAEMGTDTVTADITIDARVPRPEDV